MSYPQDFEDAVSAGNIGLLKAIKSYDPNKGASFTTWSWWKVKGAIIDYLRSLNDERVNGKIVWDCIDDFENKLPAPENDYIDLRLAIEKLSPRQRHYLDQVYWSGLELKELARAEGISTKTMSIRHQEILKILRNSIAIV